jgi:hypothetical protein
MRNKTTLAAVIAASLLGFGAAAQAQYTAIVSVAPPPARVEVVPAQRPGHVWAPGHYEWRGGQYAWIEGHWLAERQGYEYREPRWVQRGNGEWQLVGGDWERRQMERQARQAERMDPNGDSDHDGIANQYDRDRDGDGVPNRRDRFPDNPRRS